VLLLLCAVIPLRRFLKISIPKHWVQIVGDREIFAQWLLHDALRIKAGLTPSQGQPVATGPSDAGQSLPPVPTGQS
jgi:hypothetical protein